MRSTNAPDTDPAGAVLLRRPRSTDGAVLHDLIARCTPLDENSLYCNLLQCGHFADTAVAAERGGELVGFVTGYLVPQRPEILFVWQVAVDQRARGQGLGKAMLRHILMRPALAHVTELHTTITADNGASQALFSSFARDLGADTAVQDHFERDDHFAGRHATEQLWRIGPFESARLDAAVA